MLKVSHKQSLRDLTQIKQFAFGTIVAAFHEFRFGGHGRPTWLTEAVFSSRNVVMNIKMSIEMIIITNSLLVIFSKVE